MRCGAQIPAELPEQFRALQAWPTAPPFNGSQPQQPPPPPPQALGQPSAPAPPVIVQGTALPIATEVPIVQATPLVPGVVQAGPVTPDTAGAPGWN